MEMRPHTSSRDRVIVIGAGIGGLCAALRLAHQGLDVEIVETHNAVGGKMRQVPSAAGPVDAGPTVLTMRHVFDALFDEVGERLEDHVDLVPQDILARHWWSDGTQLDLLADHAASSAEIEKVFGTETALAFENFTNRTAALFDTFDTPMMQAAEPSIAALSGAAIGRPGILPAMLPWATLARLLDQTFKERKLQQLFGRYATYVGGSPYQSPALLSLIWQAEARGVWVVKGGTHTLAKKIAALFQTRGGRIRLGCSVEKILIESGSVTGVRLADESTLLADRVLFNGDPRALALGLLGQSAKSVAKQTLSKPRSLSACVWSFAAKPRGRSLDHHNVFFCDAPDKEFGDIRNGRLPTDPTLYICAEDRGQGTQIPDLERFEIIMNAPPLTQRTGEEKDYDTCRTRTFDSLKRHGLTFDPIPERPALTTPDLFNRMFPGSAGSLYGQSPHGLTAALSRPRAQVPKIAGLFLAGGGTHPGAGVPMAALSGKHAAAAILTDLASTSPSRRTAMPGGMSTGSRIVGDALSRSSGS